MCVYIYISFIKISTTTNEKDIHLYTTSSLNKYQTKKKNSSYCTKQTTLIKVKDKTREREKKRNENFMHNIKSFQRLLPIDRENVLHENHHPLVERLQSDQELILFQYILWKKQASDIVIRKINHYFLLCNFFSKYFISSSLKQCSISFNTWSICWPELIFDKCMTFENDANKPNWSRISR